MIKQKIGTCDKSKKYQKMKRIEYHIFFIVGWNLSID